jgi:hypothetical protein
MPRKTTATKPAATKKTAVRKPAAPKVAPAPGPVAGFIDAALMERAIALRAEGKTMKQIGAELNVKATAYLAKKIRATYGADALARPAKPATTKEA